MDELSAILCHPVFPANRSSAYSLPAVHMLDMDKGLSRCPLVFAYDTKLPDPTTFSDFASAIAALHIANAYFKSNSYNDRNKTVGVFNLDPRDASKQPLVEHLVFAHQMFLINPKGVFVAQNRSPVTDYDLPDIHRIGQLTSTYFAHFKKQADSEQVWSQ